MTHSYGVSLAIWDHTVLPSTQHKWTHPAFTPARQAGTRFTDHLRVEGWVSQGAKSNRPIVATRQPGASEARTHDLVITSENYRVFSGLSVVISLKQSMAMHLTTFCVKFLLINSSLLFLEYILMYRLILFVRLFILFFTFLSSFYHIMVNKND